jgi:4-hydroxy-tetrahydrodipicolinate reductase
VKVGIFGRGRLGSAAATLIEAEADMELAWSLGHEGQPSSEVDVVLDVSAAAAVPGHLAWALETGTDIVIGTTGWSRDILPGKASNIGILTAPNFSLAVAFMRRAALALGRLAALDSQADLAVLERHHRAKADSPSGTAKLLAEALVEGCPRYTGWTQSPRAEAKVSVASLRAGSEIGFHELRFEAASESIVLSHEAKSRLIFARGALRALVWIHGKKGIYSFDQMAAEIVEPLFQPPR